MSHVKYNVAETAEEVEGAIGLITRVYRAAGHISGEGNTDISEYVRKPSAITFVTYVDHEPVGTISVIHDIGSIPMDSIFKDDVDIFRRTGKVLVEVGQFAIDNNHEALQKQKMLRRSIPLSLFQLVLHYGFQKDIDLFCIAVNPVHESFYRSMGFEQFAETRSYASVSDKPAVPFVLDLKSLRQRAAVGGALTGLMADLARVPPDSAVLTRAMARVAI